MQDAGQTKRSGAGSELRDSFRGSALSLLVAGGLCLYFGFTLIADAPGSASPAEAQRWFAVDNALFWCLRGIGILFLLAAALAAAGHRVSMLLAAIAEAAFTLLMIVMTVEWTLEARADGLVNYQVILLLLLAVVAAGSARSAWSRWRASGAATRPSSGSHEELP